MSDAPNGPEQRLLAEYVAVEIACARGRFNRATRALEAAKVVFHIANREYGEASDALIKLKAEATLGRRIDGQDS